MNDETIIELMKVLLKDATPSLRHRLANALDTNMEPVWWSVEDFEHIAVQQEEYHEVPIGTKYDRSRFKECLQDMVHNADCEHGINWYTIEQYLDADCLIES
tara:strand:- start:19 stop:324 length:306 start_codon:yes stop_codon:yes gene_type:complete